MQILEKSFTHLDKGCRNAHPFWAFTQIFLRNIYPLTYLELQSQMTPCFSEKMKKYFLSGCGMVFYLPQKSLHLFGIRTSKRNLFFRKIRKIVEKIVRFKKHPLLVFTGRGRLGTVILKKQKNCPPVEAGIHERKE